MRPKNLLPLFEDTRTLKGVDHKTQQVLATLCGNRIIDLLWHIPRDYIHYTRISNIGEAEVGKHIMARVTVSRHRPPLHGRNAPYIVDCKDNTGRLQLIFFRLRGDYLARLYPPKKTLSLCGKLEIYGKKKQILHPKIFDMPLDSIPRIHPVYGKAQGLTDNAMQRLASCAFDRIPILSEWLDREMIKRNGWQGFKDSLGAIHARRLPVSSCHKQRLIYDEILSYHIAIALARRSRNRCKATPLTTSRCHRSAIALPFSLTDGQQKALREIDNDMQKTTPMMRLLQGDVGAGKTIVAFLACLNAVENGRQALVLAPTQVLARQHFNTMKNLLKNKQDVTCVLLTGQTRAMERKSILQAIKMGKAQVIIGTHALFQEEVAYKNIALVVIDEQQRFGVLQRMSLHQKALNPHVLTMTATPIPRTLLMATFGDISISQLHEKPKGRQPVDTRIMHLRKLPDIVEKLAKIITAGIQIYWICPLVEESETLDIVAAKERYSTLCRIFGTDNIALLHGKMTAQEKRTIMDSFADGKAKILVATTIVEVGVHVENAAVMIVEQAERFGLSQLHQLRGRIGRGQNAATCILLYKNISSNTKRRLDILKCCNDGFAIAEADLRLRGPGDILGVKQSGIPNMKIADLYRDRDLLKTAKNDADYLLQKDPNLTSKRGRNIRALLYIFERDHAIQILHKSG